MKLKFNFLRMSFQLRTSKRFLFCEAIFSESGHFFLLNMQTDFYGMLFLVGFDADLVF